VVKAVKEEFGLDVTRQRVHFYDPTTRAGRALHPELKELFTETRDKAKQDLDSILSYKAIRLQRLDNMITLAIERGNMPLAGCSSRRPRNPAAPSRTSTSLSIPGRSIAAGRMLPWC
jgi:hypothetical protein